MSRRSSTSLRRSWRSSCCGRCDSAEWKRVDGAGKRGPSAPVTAGGGLRTPSGGGANDAMTMETSFDVRQYPSQMLRRDHRNDRYRERQTQQAEQVHDLERGRKERRIDKASGKIGHRSLLGIAPMS